MDNSWDSSPRVEGCTFSSNSAEYYGGGMCNYDSSPTVEGCTFSGNSSGYFGGGMWCNWYSPSMANCIFWGDVPSEIYTYLLGGVRYSDVEGGWPGVGNINADPCFVEPGYWDPNGTPEDVNDDFWVEGDYHLLPDSPCINVGTNTPPGGLPETDMDGEARVMWETVDMGADEFNPIRLGIVKKTRTGRAEFVYDCNVTFTNLWEFAIKNVRLEMIKASDNIDINEPNVSFGDIEFSPRESITSIDTCTFTVDRSRAIEPAKIDWRVKCQRADTGQPLELTINGVGSSGLEGAGEGKIDFGDLAELAGQWL